MTEVGDGTRRGAGVGWRAHLAGGLVVAVGVLNALFGLLGLVSQQVLLGPAVAGGLLVAGVVTAAVGVLIWRGNRLATVAALTVFGLLLVVQLFDFLEEGGTWDEGVATHPLTRFGLLTVLVVVLALALQGTRRPRA